MVKAMMNRPAPRRGHQNGRNDVANVMKSPRGASMAPTLATMRRTSGGGFPLCFTDWRAKSVFQYGCEANASNMPTPIPRKASPVWAGVKPWISSKMIGNAWNARYSIPKERDVLIRD